MLTGDLTPGPATQLFPRVVLSVLTVNMKRLMCHESRYNMDQGSGDRETSHQDLVAQSCRDSLQQETKTM